MHIARRSTLPFALLFTLTGATLWTSPAAAEVTIVKADGWEIYTTGRVNGFLVGGVGDAYPQPLVPGSSVRPGGGLNVGSDTIPAMGPDGMVIQDAQGTFQSLRFRNGFLPNIFGFGMRAQISERTLLSVYLSLWTTIGAQGQRKTGIVQTDAREGYARLEGRWGSLLAGRSLDLFSRGATENDFLYGHGYAVGYPGDIDNVGTTAGLIGFGVLAAFFSPGVVYATPSLGGLQLTAGVYDAVAVPGAWEATRDPRPEAELTYDLAVGAFKLHLFGNGAVQNLYRPAETRSATMWGVGYGGRVEIGRFHLGVAGHYGKGLGLSYALENSPTTFDQNYNLRTFDGYSALAQVIAGKFDINVGGGMSRVFLLDSELSSTDSSLIKRQIGYFAAIVYHSTPHLHFSLDYLHGDFAWFLGEKQLVDFLSTGMTVTW